jgi:hypothetical protein
MILNKKKVIIFSVIGTIILLIIVGIFLIKDKVNIAEERTDVYLTRNGSDNYIHCVSNGVNSRTLEVKLSGNNSSYAIATV